MLWDRAFPSIHDRPPLLEFIRGRMKADGDLDDPLCVLPDAVTDASGGVTWMAGAFDGVIGHHMGLDGDAETRVDEVAEAIVAAATHPQRRELRHLYDLLNAGDVLGFLDPMIEALGALNFSTSDVAALGNWLATTSADRQPVKVGIALLGVTGAPDGAILHDLGSHEEFTLFAAQAFVNSRQDPEPDLFLLATRVKGWGRIQCVERLRHTTDPDIARWILTEGFRNSVMYEYLAYIAATTGDLRAAITSPKPDGETLRAATEIISALIAGGPAEDIDSYSDAPAVLGAWLDHVAHVASTVDEFHTANAIEWFCSGDGWTERISQGIWTAEQRSLVQGAARELLADPRWTGIVTSALGNPDYPVFHQAVLAARELGIDPFGEILARVDADPIEGPWYLAWLDTDTERAELLTARARHFFNLTAISTGPTNHTGLGPEFKVHSALGWSLQGVASHPGVGADLIDAALWSPSVQNRNQAMNALVAWGRPHWSHHHIDRLEVLAASDPNERIRVRAIDVLSTLPPAPV